MRLVRKSLEMECYATHNLRKRYQTRGAQNNWNKCLDWFLRMIRKTLEMDYVVWSLTQNRIRYQKRCAQNLQNGVLTYCCVRYAKPSKWTSTESYAMVSNEVRRIFERHTRTDRCQYLYLIRLYKKRQNNNSSYRKFQNKLQDEKFIA